MAESNRGHSVSRRSAYRGVAEVSVYVDPDHSGKGAGRQLLDALVAASENAVLWMQGCGENRSHGRWLTAGCATHEAAKQDRGAGHGCDRKQTKR